MGQELERLLQLMIERNASDLLLGSGRPPCVRVDGEVIPVVEEALAPERVEDLARGMMTEDQYGQFEARAELDLAYEFPHLEDRFRVNIYWQRGEVALALRRVRREIPSFEELNLPADVLKELALEPRGLVLVTGTAGSGKSTTLAAMIDQIVRHRRVHVVTVEDPIEFWHEDRIGIVDQREIGLDTRSFAEALKHIVRQSPDVMLIGEMRDRETIHAALISAETGHLVLSTLHSLDPSHTIERIINFFPLYQHPEIRLQLSQILRGVVSLRLLPCASGRGRVPAVAILRSTPTVRKLILEGHSQELSSVMRSGEHFGMCTFNQSLLELYRDGRVTLETALGACDSPDEFKLMARGITTGSASSRVRAPGQPHGNTEDADRSGSETPEREGR
ncbi:MAG: type IV pilus twitching motility protein PilT [Candidatus Bipolaricaulia bacterium]